MRRRKGIFAFWKRIQHSYDKVLMRGNSDRSAWMGIQSMLYSIFGNAVIVGCAWLAALLIVQQSSWLRIAALVLVAVVAFMALVRGVVAAIICLVYQFILNRRPMTWIALAVLILSTVAAVIISLWFLGIFGKPIF